MEPEPKAKETTQEKLSNILSDFKSTDESVTDDESPELRPVALLKSPAKKIKKQDFNLCLICNATTTTRQGKPQKWTPKSWDTFCSAALRIQDETFTRLESFITGKESLPLDVAQLWKHPGCYSKYKNPKTVEQKERKRLQGISAEKMQQDLGTATSNQEKHSTTITTRSKAPKGEGDTSCLICMKERKWLVRSKTVERTMKITLVNAGDALIVSARQRNDERILRDIGPVREGGHMIAKDVMVHNSCRASFISKRNMKIVKSQPTEVPIYEKAFLDVANEVEQRVINGKEVLLMKDLISYMNNILAPQIPEPSYRSWRLKSRLVEKFGTKISFWHPKWRGESELVYSDEVPSGKFLMKFIKSEKELEQKEAEAKEEAENLQTLASVSNDSPDELRYAFSTSLQIHNDIQSVPDLPWPPCPEDMTEDNIKLPNTLYNSLAWIIGGDQYNDAKKEVEDTSLSSDHPITRSQTPSGIGDFSCELHWRDKKVVVQQELHRKILSIGQDIVHAASNSRTLTVKHVVLAKAIQQKTGSLSLVSLLNQNQHCMNKSLLQEMDTANAELLVSQSDLGYHMPQGMIPNIPPLFGWDNNDYKNRGHFSGTQQVHDTTGYMAQPRPYNPSSSTEPEAAPEAARHVSPPKTRRRSIKPSEERIKTCIISKKTDPPRYRDAAQMITTLKPEVAEKAQATDLAWKLSRMDFNLTGSVNPVKQEVPGWKGFNSNVIPNSSSLRGELLPHRIGYCQTIHKPPDNDVIYTFLCRSVEMTDKVMDSDHGRGTCSVPVVVDMGIWFKAIQIILSKRTSDPRMSRIVLHQGPFHTAMRFLACPGFLFGSAGLLDIFIEAGILAEGSVDKVLKGEHWERGVYAHILVAEAFSRLRFTAFLNQLEGTNKHDKLKSDVDRLRHEISPEALETLTASENFKEISLLYKEYIASLGQNGKFWSMYIDIIDLLLRYVRASRTGNWVLSLHSELEMLPWFFACGRTVYGRYKPLYLLMMLNLADTHPDAEEQLLNGNLFTIQKSSNNPFGRVPADQETEMGVNRDSKSPGGIADISMKPAATFKWEILSTQRAEFVRRVSVLTGDKKDKSYTADDAGKKRVKKDEEKVQLVMNTIGKWNNPFTDDGPLCHISSGRQASEAVANDMLNAHQKGKQSLVQFVTERLQTPCSSGEVPDEVTDNVERMDNSDVLPEAAETEAQTSFYDRWPKLTLRNFASMIKPKKRTIKGQTFRMRYTRDLFHKMTVIAMERGLSIDEVLEFPLGPLPYSLANENGGLVKTSKPVLMHELEKLAEPEETPSTTSNQVIILDAMALLQTLKLAHNTTFGDLAETVMKMIMRYVPPNSATPVHWVCDTYPEISIKNAERDSRMESAEGSFATTITSSKQRVDKQFKKALRDGKFKESLAQFMIDEWKDQKYAAILGRRTLLATSGTKCYAFSVSTGHMQCQEIPELEYKMEEADQRLILHAHFASCQDPQPDIVIIRSPDTDVMVLASAACGLGWITTKCLFLTGTSSKTRYINLTDIGAKLGESACEGLIGAHPFTGCDSTCAFKGRGKLSVLWLLQNNEFFCRAMSSLGRSLIPTDELFTSCEEATCILYSFNSRSKKLKPVPTYSVNELRAIMFASGTSDPAKLPPCQDALRKKVLRANYQAYINRSCIHQQEELPSPHGHGWIVSETDNIQIDWMDVLPAPNVVLAMTCCGCNTDCKSNKCGCYKNGLRCTGICTCTTECMNQSKHINADIDPDEALLEDDIDTLDMEESDTDAESDLDTDSD